MLTGRDYLTPPELARRWRCDAATVVAHIKTGRLRAFTLSKPGSRRPRWRIPEDAVIEFENQQAATPPAKPLRATRTRPRDPSFIEYF